MCGGSAGAIPEGRGEGGIAVTIGGVVVVAVVVHVAKCLAVFAVSPSVRVHRIGFG